VAHLGPTQLALLHTFRRNSVDTRPLASILISYSSRCCWHEGCYATDSGSPLVAARRENKLTARALETYWGKYCLNTYIYKLVLTNPALSLVRRPHCSPPIGWGATLLPPCHPPASTAKGEGGINGFICLSLQRNTIFGGLRISPRVSSLRRDVNIKNSKQKWNFKSKQTATERDSLTKIWYAFFGAAG
jgi:hypothetical protein